MQPKMIFKCQTPDPEELLALGGAVATESLASDFLTALGTGVLAHKQRQTVNDEGLPLTEHFSQPINEIP